MRLVVAVTLVCLPGTALGDNATLTAIVGVDDGFNITLNDASGKKVSRIPPGTYTIVVHDESAIHNFHLASNFDATVDFKTGLEFVGTQTFTVTFRNHTTYAYACEPHWQVMNGSFLVTDTPIAPPPPPPPPPPPVTQLAASVSATGSVHLSRSSVPAGRVRVAVTDRSKTANFHMAGKGVNRRTGLKFRGSTSWSLRLAPGAYRYGTDGRRLTGTLRVK
jgi:copper binding plastocyanin/azurin family protein